MTLISQIGGLSDPNLCCSPEVHKLELNALHLASGRGDLDMVRTLLRAGADVNFTNVHGYTALHFAALRGEQAACQLLIEVTDTDHLYAKSVFTS